MKVLHLNLYRKYFDAILKGDKVVEYRDITPYWSKRLEGRHYDIIQFRNGYAKGSSNYEGRIQRYVYQRFTIRFDIRRYIGD